ncbi:MAG: formate/nitrite transporter family protein [Myxococcaceae bacterium]|nr:formate/nitrite transporter family protein [Myxococcaceae bacterium]
MSAPPLRALPRRGFRHGSPRTVHLTEPSQEALARLGEWLGLDFGVVRQLQNPELVPGVVQIRRTTLFRFDVPHYRPDAPLDWKRVDVIIAPRLAVTISPEGASLVPRALERWEEAHRPKTPGTLLALIAAEDLDSMEKVLARFHAHHEHLTHTGSGGEPLGRGESLKRLRAQVATLLLGLGTLNDVLDRFERWRPKAIDEAECAELIGVRDRAIRNRRDAQTLHDELEELQESISGSAGVLDVESPRIVEIAASVGEHQLVRMTPAHAISGIIGGMAVSFGTLAMAVVAGPLADLGEARAALFGALLFPIGFLILVIGRGELFTENFFVPVTSVWMERARWRDLFVLWSTTLLFNLIGAAILGWVMTRHGVLHPEPADFIRRLAERKATTPHWPMFFQSVAAGWAVTLMTWLMLATRGQGPRMVMVWCMGFLIAGAGFNHVVVAAGDIFMGMFLGAPITLTQWLWNNFGISVLGNLLGGILFVTLAGYLQAHAINAGERREQPPVQKPRAARVPRRQAEA